MIDFLTVHVEAVRMNEFHCAVSTNLSTAPIVVVMCVAL